MRQTKILILFIGKRRMKLQLLCVLVLFPKESNDIGQVFIILSALNVPQTMILNCLQHNNISFAKCTFNTVKYRQNQTYKSNILYKQNREKMNPLTSSYTPDKESLMPLLIKSANQL